MTKIQIFTGTPNRRVKNLQERLKNKFQLIKIFFVKQGPAADATTAPQPWGLLCNPVMKRKMISSFFFIFPSNGAPMEWNWQGKTEVLGGKTCPSTTLSTTNPTWTDPGSITGLRGVRLATNRLSHGTALVKALLKFRIFRRNNLAVSLLTFLVWYWQHNGGHWQWVMAY